MFNLTYFSESKPEGTIKFERFPNHLGNFKDVEGNIWNINAILGKTVCACKVSELHPYFSDTSTFCNYGMVSQTWKPYLVEVEKI